MRKKRTMGKRLSRRYAGAANVPGREDSTLALKSLELPLVYPGGDPLESLQKETIGVSSPPDGTETLLTRFFTARFWVPDCVHAIIAPSVSRGRLEQSRAVK